MAYFNKDDFQQLKHLPRSDSQKKATMNRIRNNSKQSKTYPKKYIITTITALLLAIILIAPELLNSKQQVMAPIDDSTDSIVESDNLSSIILDAINIGMTEEEITQLIEPYIASGDVQLIGDRNYSIWRYEFKKTGDYLFAHSYLQMDAMSKGNIEMLLFIYWDEQRKVEQYSAIYRDGTDGLIYDVRKLQDNTFLKQPIYPSGNVNTENIFTNLEMVKTQLHVGMTMGEVKEKLGEHFKVGANIDNGTLIWTYNFGENPDKNMNGGIEIKEFEEMLNGKFQAKFHVYWDQNNLFSGIYGIYLNEEEQKIYEYGLFSDGQSKDQVIYNGNINTEIAIQMKDVEEQIRIAENFTYDDYKKVFDEVVLVANTLLDDEQLKKWIIRTLAQEKLYYETDLTTEEIMILAKQQLQKDKVWKAIAQDEYNISITDEEIDTYIKEGPDTSDLPQHLAYADALNLTLKELNHTFDRDVYEKNVIWLKLKPILEKKYDTSDNNKLVEKYEEEVNKQLK